MTTSENHRPESRETDGDSHDSLSANDQASPNPAVPSSASPPSADEIPRELGENGEPLSPQRSALARMAVMMVETSDAANAGAVCRAMKNFGLRDLVLVNPRAEEPQGGRAQALACAASDILMNAELAPSMEEGAGRRGIEHLAAFSARVSSVRGQFVTPEKFADEALPILASGGRIALVLGREDRGLSNEEIAMCRWKINIPTAAYSSLNVAQAGVVGMYALYQRVYERPELIQPVRAASASKAAAATAPTGPEEMERLMAMFERLFDLVKYSWKDNPMKVTHPLRQILQRAEVTQRETGMMMSFVRRALYALGDKSETREARRARRAAKSKQENDGMK